MERPSKLVEFHRQCAAAAVVLNCKLRASVLESQATCYCGKRNALNTRIKHP